MRENVAKNNNFLKEKMEKAAKNDVFEDKTFFLIFSQFLKKTKTKENNLF